MTSARLSRVADWLTGDQEKCHSHQMWNTHRAHVERIQRAIRKVVRSPGLRSAGQLCGSMLLHTSCLLRARVTGF